MLNKSKALKLTYCVNFGKQQNTVPGNSKKSQDSEKSS